MMKRILTFLILLCVYSVTQAADFEAAYFPISDYKQVKKKIPALIPRKKEGRFGYVNHDGRFVIQPEYNVVGFYTEDCNLLNSSNEKVRKFGSADYASVTKGNVDYRIDKTGKKVYTFKDSDLAMCSPEFKKQRFNAYIQNGYFGLINNETFNNPMDYRQFVIYPQYEYLYILEGNDLANPMIVASHNDKFGIIDAQHHIIVPFEYSDIKRNFSWKLAHLFEVTENGTDYFFVDIQNKRY